MCDIPPPHTHTVARVVPVAPFASPVGRLLLAVGHGLGGGVPHDQVLHTHLGSDRQVVADSVRDLVQQLARVVLGSAAGDQRDGERSDAVTWGTQRRRGQARCRGRHFSTPVHSHGSFSDLA